jgi:hypothetical protein
MAKRTLIDRLTKPILLISILCVVFALLINIACQRDKYSFTLKKELEIGAKEGNENYIFAAISDIEVNPGGDIFTLDSKLLKVSKFSKDGNFLLSFGKGGQGPGEFQSPSAIALDNDNRIYVLDLMRIMLFDEKGAFISSFSIDFMGIDIAMGHDGTLIVLGPRDDKIFSAYDKRGALLYSFGTQFSVPDEFAKFRDARLFKTPLKVWVNDNKIYVMNPYKCEIVVYENKKIKDKILNDKADYLKPEFKEVTPGGFSGVVSWNCVYESKRYLFAFYDGKNAKRLDVYRNKKLLSSMGVKGDLYLIDKAGRFYFIENDDYQKLVIYSGFPQ